MSITLTSAQVAKLQNKGAHVPSHTLAPSAPAPSAPSTGGGTITAGQAASGMTGMIQRNPIQPNQQLSGILQGIGMNPSAPNWNQINPNVSGITGSLNVEALNQIASRGAGGGTALGALAPLSPQDQLGNTLSIPTDPYMDEYDQYAQRYKEQADAVIDPNRIYQDQLRMYQAEIDAVNQLYQSHLQEAQRQGQGRLGSSTALQARSGLLGSDFGQAQTDEMQRYNLGIEGGIRAEQNAKIGAIHGEVRRGAAQEIESKNIAKQQGAEAYMQFLTEKSSRRQTQIQKIASMVLEGELDPDSINWNKTLEDSGLKWEDIKPVYDTMNNEYKAAQQNAQYEQMERDSKLRKTEAEIAKIENDIENGNILKIGEGDMLYDLRTGETYKNPKTYAPTSSSNPASSGDGWDTARQFIEDNKNQPYDTVRNALLEKRKELGLDITAVNSLLSEYGVVKNPITLTPSQMNGVAEQIIKKTTPWGTSGNEGLEMAREYARRGKLTVKGKEVQLTPQQIEMLLQAIDNTGERTRVHKTLPGGR